MNVKKRRNKGNSLIAFPNDYCVIDIETTGYDTTFNEIIELASIHISNNEIVDSFQSLVKPSVKIDKFIEQLTGITNTMLSSAPSLEKILPDFLDFIGSCIVIGHNVNFDVNFIFDSSLVLLGTEFKNDFVDTLRLSRKLYPELSHHRLKDLVEFFHFPDEQMHRALTDCKYTFQAFEEMRKKVLTDYDSVDNFFATFSSKKYYRNPVKAKDMTTAVTEFDTTHPLYKKYCVFTGELKIPRKQAMQYVLDLGGMVEDNITKKTNYLIVGNYSKISSVKNGKTGKIKKAELYRLQGYDIQILSENTFYDMLFDL